MQTITHCADKGYLYANMSGRSLISCPEAYLKSLKCYFATLDHGNPTSECIKKHAASLISDFKVNNLLECQSPFCILSVGSGEGGDDLSFIESLSKFGWKKNSKCQFFQRTIEPDKNVLEVFRAKAEDLSESWSRADVQFEWFPMTYQEYIEQKKTDDVRFDVVHFFHSIYYVDVQTALEHCYEKELGAKGVIICLINDEQSVKTKYYREFSSQGLILNRGAFYSSKEVADVAKKNGWKNVECPGEANVCDITAIFDRSSVEGNLMLDFLTHWKNVVQTASQDNLRKILNFWENECTEDERGRKVLKWQTKAVMILKGM